MSREVEYRRYAAALLDLAKRAATAAGKARLLVMAEAWLALAAKLGWLRTRRPREGARHYRVGHTTDRDQPSTDC
jgi:hypothetical protein